MKYYIPTLGKGSPLVRFLPHPQFFRIFGKAEGATKAENLQIFKGYNSKGIRFMSIAKDAQIDFRFFFFEFPLHPGNIYF
jgi:hypothetical protein